MSGQGYHLALNHVQVDEVLSCNDEMGILDWVDQALGECDWDAGYIHGGYKDWNILLGCLTNGDYDPKGGTYPLNRCFFGGDLLVTEGSIVNLVMPNTDFVIVMHRTHPTGDDLDQRDPLLREEAVDREAHD